MLAPDSYSNFHTVWLVPSDSAHERQRAGRRRRLRRYINMASHDTITLAVGAASIVAVLASWWRRRARSAAPLTAAALSDLMTHRALQVGQCVFCLNVTLVVKPERREEFLGKILADQEGTLRDEPDALLFLVGEDTAVRNTFYLHEEYVGEAGFEAHKRAPHFAPWQAFCDSNPFVAPPQVCFYHKL